MVIPGRYTVVLDYDGRKSQRSFQVALDPRLHPAPDALQQRFALEMQIHAALTLSMRRSTKPSRPARSSRPPWPTIK